jgi:hypothetical protein
MSGTFVVGILAGSKIIFANLRQAVHSHYSDLQAVPLLSGFYPHSGSISPHRPAFLTFAVTGFGPNF